MAIHYKETVHRVECDCGQGFYVSVGNVDKRKLKPTVRTATRCPACGHVSWLKSLACQSPPPTVQPHAKAIDPTLLFEDLPVMEETINILQRDFHLARNQMHSIAAAARTALDHWERFYSRAIMPKEFERIRRVLKEIDQLPIPPI